MSYTIVIPARFNSTRLPGKVLRDIAGKPLIQHVYEQAIKTGAQRVCIATDDQRVMQTAKAFGAEVVLTAPSHESGTERIAEAVTKLALPADSIVVNIQGDEVMLPEALVEQLVDNLQRHPQASMATLCGSIQNVADVFNPNMVKVIFDHTGLALYFSRAPIPWERNRFAAIDRNNPVVDEPITAHWYRHIGIYAYRVSFLQKYVTLPPSPLEQLESLEQLRALYYGYKIHVGVTHNDTGIAVDTAEDLQRAEALFKRNNI